MRTYLLPNSFFKKKWVWFAEPRDEEGVDMLDVFSYRDVDAPGFKQKHSLTTCVDTTQDLEVIWRNMRESFVCKQIEQGRRRGVEVRQDENFDAFEKMYRAFRKEKGIPLQDPAIFRENCMLFSAYYEGEMIAGGAFMEDGTYMRTFVYASKRLTVDSGRMRDIIGQAGRIINWEVFQFAHNNGYEHVDLGGIDPDSEDKSEQSLARFKESFGGERTPCFYYHKTYSPILRGWERVRKYIT